MNPPAMITHLLLLPRNSAQAAKYLRIDSHGRILERRSAEAGEPLASESGIRRVVVVPGENVGTLWLELPARSPAQALAAARIMLQDRLASQGDPIHIAIAPGLDPDAPRPVAFVAESQMQSWLQQCAELGFTPDVMIPEQLVLETPGDVVRVFERDGVWLVRGRRSAFVAEPELVKQVISVQTGELVADPALVEVHIAQSMGKPHAEQLDLLHHGHARVGTLARLRWRRISVLVVLCVASPLLLLCVQISRDALGTYWMQARTEAVAKYAKDASLPNGIEVPAALHVHYLNRVSPILLASQAGGLFEALQELPGTQLQSLDYNVEDGLRAGLLHSNEADLNTLRESLATRRLELVPLDSQAVDGGLTTQVVLRTAR